MQKDFHFYAIYSLCRATGMLHSAAQKVSYSSQFVDDAIYGHIIEFKDGGWYEQILTAWNFGTSDTEQIQNSFELLNNESIQNKILVPFHFIPGNTNEPYSTSFRERMICRENSVIANEMLDHVIELSAENSLHLLGIGLHSFADTWAHQNFSGQFTGLDDNSVNKISNAQFSDKKPCPIKGIYAVPLETGHGQAGNAPDLPYAEWSYDHEYLKANIFQNNSDRFLSASEAIYFKLLKFKNTDHGKVFFSTNTILWKDLEDELYKLFQNNNSEDTEERCRFWEEKLADDFLGFGKTIVHYNNREWFYQAINVVGEHPDKTIFGKFSDLCARLMSALNNKPLRTRSQTKDIYQRLDGFENSSWKLHNDSAAYLRFYILTELLSKHGIYCA